MAEENKPGQQTSSATADTQNKLQSSKEHARKAAEDLKSAAGAFAEEYRGKAEQAWGEARGKAEQAWGDATSRVMAADGRPRIRRWLRRTRPRPVGASRGDEPFRSQLVRSDLRVRLLRSGHRAGTVAARVRAGPRRWPFSTAARRDCSAAGGSTTHGTARQQSYAIGRSAGCRAGSLHCRDRARGSSVMTVR